MSPKKLSEEDKSEILKFYRLPDETTSTLAIRYGVSNSTISRFLKSNIDESEYDFLIQQKRSIRSQNNALDVTNSEELPINTTIEAKSVLTVNDDVLIPDHVIINDLHDTPSINNSIEGRRRKRSSATLDEDSDLSLPLIQQLSFSLPLDNKPITPTETNINLHTKTDVKLTEEDLEEDNYPQEEVLSDIFPEELSVDDDQDDDQDDDIDDDQDDDIDDDQEDWDEDDNIYSSNNPYAKKIFITSRSNLQVIPLSQASLPKVCYIVVDKMAELITKPLKDFSDLGGIPVEEVQQRTLPVFDNHRVAKRFSNRHHRVIKVPDSRVLKKTSYYLKEKGITRLLIDGQIYSLN